MTRNSWPYSSKNMYKYHCFTVLTLIDMPQNISSGQLVWSPMYGLLPINMIISVFN